MVQITLNMRKPILSTLLALLGAATLSAQMMPDSTVAITAYWEVGDKMDYKPKS